jgi:hypothetical protein
MTSASLGMDFNLGHFFQSLWHPVIIHPFPAEA